MTLEEATAVPSSEKATAPLAAMRAISASSLPSRALGDCTHGKHMGEARALGLAIDELDARIVVERRLGVGHAADGGEPAGDRRGGAGGDGFFFFLAGLAEVDMRIDQAGADDAARGVEQAGIGAEVRRGHITHMHDAAIVDDQIGGAVEFLSGVDHPRR